jgi:hypothetical protein
MVTKSGFGKIIGSHGRRDLRSFPAQSVLPDTAKVSNLFSHSGWNINLVEEVFLPFEADFIKLIPLRGRDRQDKLVWSGTKTGAFSVQSGY